MLCNFERTSVEDIGQKEKERDKGERESVYYYSAIVMLLCSRLHQI